MSAVAKTKANQAPVGFHQDFDAAAGLKLQVLSDRHGAGAWLKLPGDPGHYLSVQSMSHAGGVQAYAGYRLDNDGCDDLAIEYVPGTGQVLIQVLLPGTGPEVARLRHLTLEQLHGLVEALPQG